MVSHAVNQGDLNMAVDPPVIPPDAMAGEGELSEQTTETEFARDGAKSPSMDKKRGILYALIVLLGNGVHPIINNSRPSDLNALIFSFYYCFWEFLAAYLLYGINKKTGVFKADVKIIDLRKDPIHKRQNIFILVFIMVLYSIATLFYTLGLQLAGSVSGSIALKVAPIYSLIFGALILKEKIDIRLVGVIIGILVALVYLGTEGTFEIQFFSVGFGILLLVPLLWSVAHAYAKKLMIRGIVTPFTIIIIRAGFVFISLFITSLFIDGWDKISYSLTNPEHLVFAFLFGIIYFLMHVSWYATMRILDIGYASAFVNPSPFITALLVLLITKEPIRLYHVVGMIAIVGGLYLMIYINNHPRKGAKR